MNRILLIAIVVLCLLVQTQAQLVPILMGGGLTLIVNVIAGGLNPLFAITIFASSTLMCSWREQDLLAEEEQKYLNRIEHAKNPNWVSCGVDHFYKVAKSCRSKNGCDYSLDAPQNPKYCNVCGKDAMWAVIHTDPENRMSYDTALLCKELDGTVVQKPFPTLPHGLWDCSKVPHYSECRKCGTTHAQYVEWTNAGVIAHCYNLVNDDLVLAEKKILI